MYTPLKIAFYETAEFNPERQDRQIGKCIRRFAAYAVLLMVSHGQWLIKRKAGRSGSFVVRNKKPETWRLPALS